MSADPSTTTSHPATGPWQRMDLGEVLTTAMDLYRGHWQALIGIAAVLLGTMTVLNLLLEQATLPLLAAIPVGLTVGGLYLTLTEFLARALVDAHFGEPVSVTRTLRSVAPRVHSLLWVDVLRGLLVGAASLLFVIPGIFLGLRVFFADTVVVVEGKRGSAALEQSWWLVTGHAVRLFGYGILFVLCLWLVSAVGAGIFSLTPLELATPLGQTVVALTLLLATIIGWPFVAAVKALLYIDLRTRTDGLDHPEPEAGKPSSPAPPPAPSLQ